jgi:hypothetical protein
MLKSLPGGGQGSLDQLILGQLKFSTFNIVRSFSFVGDPVYWTDDGEDKSRPNEVGLTLHGMEMRHFIALERSSV